MLVQSGAVVPGFSRDEATPLTGDDLAFAPTWASGKEMRQAAGKRIRLAFYLQSARIFSFRAAVQ